MFVRHVSLIRRPCACAFYEGVDSLTIPILNFYRLLIRHTTFELF